MNAAAQLMPAHNLDAEGALLGAVMLDDTVLDEIALIVHPGDMYSDANKRILEAAYELCEGGQPVESVTVAGWLKSRNLLQAIGGMPYLLQLVDTTPAIANAAVYARTIRDHARTRKMVSVCQRVAITGQGPIRDVQEWLQESEQSVFEAAEDSRESELAEPLSEILRGTIKDIDERRKSDGGQVYGHPTGFIELTNKLNGYVPGKLYVVAGRPGMGKSAFLSASARHVAAAGLATIVVSAEMTKHEQAVRLLAAEADIPIQGLMSGQLKGDEWARTCAAADTLRKLPIALGYKPGATVPQIRSVVRKKLRELRREHGEGLQLGLIGVDYIQILRGHGDSREQEVSELSRGLLQMGGEMGAPVMALSQLNREVEKRPNKRPQLSDLRESGAIEQDAYAVLFLYRDEYYNKNTPDHGIVEVNVAKHRNGPSGVVALEFEGESTRFDNLDPQRAAQKAFDDLDERYP